VHDDVEGPKSVDHVLGDVEGAVIIELTVSIGDREPLERQTTGG